MKRKRSLPGKIIASIFLAIVGFMALFPLVWMVLASFKKKTEVFRVPLTIFPETWQLDNYRKVFGDATAKFGISMLSTLMVSVLAVFLAMLINTMAAYAFARLEFYGKKFLWAYCIMTMFIPGLTIMLTSFLVVYNLGMLNTYAVLILPGLASGYNIFFFRQFYLNFPMALEDAARIDGAGRLRIYFKIFLPMSKAPLVVLGMGVFMGYWNSFLWPSLTVNDPGKMQIMQLIRSLSSVYATEYGAIMAATTIAIIPPLALFLFFKKYIVQGVVLSGIK